MSTYIGLDQSLNNTGIAVWRDGKLSTSVIKLTASNTVLERVALTRWVLKILFKTLKPEGIYMEDIFMMRRNIKAVVSLIRVETAIQLLCMEEQLQWKSMSASPRLKTSWLAQLGFKNPKEDAAKFFLPYYKESTTVTGKPNVPTDHETDALGILLGGLISDRKVIKQCIIGVQINRIDPKSVFRNPDAFANSFL